MKKKILVAVTASAFLSIPPAAAFWDAGAIISYDQGKTIQQGIKAAQQIGTASAAAMQRIVDAVQQTLDAMGKDVDPAVVTRLNNARRNGYSCIKSNVGSVKGLATMATAGTEGILKAIDYCVDGFVEQLRLAKTAGLTLGNRNSNAIDQGSVDLGNASNRIFQNSAKSGEELLRPSKAETVEDDFVQQVHHYSSDRAVTVNEKTLFSDERARQRLSAWLTSEPIIPIGNEEEDRADNGALPNKEERRMLMAKALIGFRSTAVIDPELLQKGGRFLLAERYKKFARMQLARTSYLETVDGSTTKYLADAYKTWVASNQKIDDKVRHGAIDQTQMLKAIYDQNKMMMALNMQALRQQLVAARMQAVQLAIAEENNSGSAANRGGGGSDGISNEGNTKNGVGVVLEDYDQ